METSELYDLLILTNRYTEVCKEFSGVLETREIPFHEFISEKIIQPTIDNFKVEQMNALKQFLENEDWTRLPLPD